MNMKIIVLVLVLLVSVAWADEMPKSSPAFAVVTEVFIKSGAIKAGCGKLDQKNVESLCGYAEMSGSLVRQYVDLVLRNETAVSSWEADPDPETRTFYKSFSVAGNQLDIVLFDASEFFTTLQFYYYR